METLEKSRSPEQIPVSNEYNEYVRRYNDTVTWLAEVLDGRMFTSFDYQFDGTDLRAEDGSKMCDVFEASLADAKNIALQQPSLWFEQRRRQHEMNEYNDMIAIMRGDLPNTMVVVSDFPPELMNTHSDVGGYNVARKQTMLRVITRNDDGTMSMRSQSLDKSDRTALENIYFELGFMPSAGELLGQRMHLQLDDADARELLSGYLTRSYDKALEAKHGKQFFAGRSDRAKRNTADFVASQNDLIQTYIHNDLYETIGLKRAIAAAMTERFEGRAKEYDASQVFSSESTLHSMNVAGKRADETGKTFSGCGQTLTAKGQLEELGLGNKACIEVKNGQKVKCPGCSEMVKAIVSASKETIHCSNASCKLAHPSIKHASRRKRSIKHLRKKDSRSSRKKGNGRTKHEKHKRLQEAW